MAGKAVSQRKDGFFSRLNPFAKKSLSPAPSQGWWRISEPFTGAWQRNIEWKRETVIAHNAIFGCMTLIASDISKLRVKLVREYKGIWDEIKLGDYKVLARPNGFQNRIQFMENWVLSKLARGNAYMLKVRNNKGIVTKLYVLNPDRVLPLVSESGDVFYQLSQDNLSGIQEASVSVPASEIIHDRFNCLFHPLVGLSPMFACGLAAYMGIKIQENSSRHFQHMSRPSGILTAPGNISDEVAARLKENWETNYSGDNYGRTAVLGDDLKYQPLAITAEESQMVEQLKITSEIVCSTFHVPAYKVIGNALSYNNIEALEGQYYSQCLQILIESIELLLDEGLEIPEGTGTEFDLDNLLRMDTKTQVETLGQGVTKAIFSPNEARRRLNLKPVSGGDTPYLQQQNYSLLALSKRDAKDDPFGKQSGKEDTPPEPDDEKQALAFALSFRKELREVRYDV